MIYKAYKEDTARLIELPESGMGYQWIQAQRPTQNNTEKFLVLNAQIIIELDDHLRLNENLLKHVGFKSMVQQVNALNIITSSIKVLPRIDFVQEKRTLTEYKSSITKRHTGGSGAVYNMKENANGYEVFVRLSAYEDDVRIDFINRKLKDGSYCTTREDYNNCVATSDDPIDRYALPNDDSIEWAFFVKPTIDDKLQRGTVQPNYGHNGGGIEVYFQNGTSDNTYLYRDPYGA